jgi:osmotically-inducible protein OsmY
MPKSNIELQSDVEQELKYEPSVDASDIGVTAKNGVVTLTGDVRSYADKYAAVQAAQRVSGVRAVADEITVDLPSIHVRGDGDIAKAASNALQWDVQVPTDLVKVEVEDGWITLTGEVNFKFQQAAAYNAVRNLTGVKGVTNLITIKQPAVSAMDVKDNIDGALRRAAELDASGIPVEVDGGKVTLQPRFSRSG